MSCDSPTKIDNYPKSSCPCFNCCGTNFESRGGTPSNLAVANCHVDSLYDCYDARPFRRDIEPDPEKNEIRLLNPQVYLNNFDKSWGRFPKQCVEGYDCCPGTLYWGDDPTLIDVPRGERIPLDRPPLTDNVKMADVYSPALTRYGKDYTTYSDISAGMITYYVDRRIEDPFFSPNFVTAASMDAAVWKDPMGAMKPQYERRPLRCNDPIRSQKDTYEYGLSWMDDTTAHRQDLMAKQMSKRNQERWEPRWV